MKNKANRMGAHIGPQKHTNCFDQVLLGSSFLPQSATLMRDQHLCDAIIIVVKGAWKLNNFFKMTKIAKL